MRYKITAPIEGDLFSRENNLSAENNGYLFEFTKDESGKITHISISTKIPEELKHKFKSTFVPTEGKAKFAINIGGDKDFDELLLSKLRVFEGELAFSTRGAFWKVLRSNIEFNVLPETADEEEQIAISGYSLNQDYPATPTFVTQSVLKAFVELVDDKSSLIVPKGFWQQGLNFFRTNDYIHAFYSFFFILEEFFADGKTGEDEVVKRFARSTEFRKACENANKALQKEERHRRNLQKFCLEEQLEFNADNLPKFLFIMRGRMHHYSSRNPKTQATPYSQKEFESISFLTMLIALYVLGNRVEKEAKETGKKLIFSSPPRT